MSTEFYLTMARDIDSAALAEALSAALQAEGYTAYDPFPGGEGPARIWAEKVTAFVSPPRDGWVSVIGRVPPKVLAAASETLDTPLLHLWLTAPTWGYLLFVDGDDKTDINALAGFLRPESSIDDLQQAMTGEIDSAALDPIEGETGEDTLPENVLALAADHDVDMDKAQRMIDKYTNKIFSKLDTTETDADDAALREAALKALHGGESSLWNTPNGQRLRAFATCLALPEDWYQPAMETVRDAYTVVRRSTVRPGGTLLPSDMRALNKLPNAGEYLPVYYGIPKVS